MLIGVDTGGTFTDLVLQDGSRAFTHKVASTPDDYARAITEGIRDLLGMMDSASRQQFVLVHSSTVATNLMQIPAEVVGLIFRQRWTVEIFFRFFKHVLGYRHLLSHWRNGIEIQVYTAIITCILIALWTGRKPTLRTVERLRFYFIGWANADELETHVAKLKKLND